MALKLRGTGNPNSLQSKFRRKRMSNLVHVVKKIIALEKISTISNLCFARCFRFMVHCLCSRILRWCCFFSAQGWRHLMRDPGLSGSMGGSLARKEVSVLIRLALSCLSSPGLLFLALTTPGPGKACVGLWYGIRPDPPMPGCVVLRAAQCRSTGLTR